MLLFALAAEKAPDFTLKGIDGKTYSLSDFKGKVVLLDFWAVWCPPCRASIPFFESLYERYRDSGLVVIGVSLDRRKDVLKRYVQNMGVQYVILWDRDGMVADLYNAYSLPTTLIIDPDGNVVIRRVGFSRSHAYLYERTIKRLLKERCKAQGKVC